MNQSLMFLSPSDRARVWSAIDRGEIPYPVNGLVPTMLVEWVCHPYKDDEFPPKGYADGDGPSNRSKCTCTKPFGSRVVKCGWCRGNDASIKKNQATMTEALAKQAPPATVEYRRFKCSNPNCWHNRSDKDEDWTNDHKRVGGRKVGTSEPCNQCRRGTATVIACDRDGTPLDTARPATGEGKRYLRESRDASLVWEFGPEWPTGVCCGKGGIRTKHHQQGAWNSLLQQGYTEITAAEAEAMLHA